VNPISYDISKSVSQDISIEPANAIENIPMNINDDSKKQIDVSVVVSDSSNGTTVQINDGVQNTGVMIDNNAVIISDTPLE
jgi:N12 class adenine-specific DNA methylase